MSEVRLIDANKLIKTLRELEWITDNPCDGENVLEDIINNAPTVEEVEEPFITECRNTAIKENLPLYFVYYEEAGVFEVYITKTKELFEKRHCIKHLSEYRFKELAMQYLDDYSDWEGGRE